MIFKKSFQCTLSIIFFVSMIYMQLKTPINDKLEFYNSLNKNQKNKYNSIKKFRLKLYFQGYFYGFLLSIGLILFNIKNKHILKPTTMFCTITAVMFLFQYFYYILSPKPDYMVLHLKTQEQKEGWLKVYRKMQIQYHIGLVIGIIAVSFFSILF